jgi:hypothetical protein
MSGGINMDNYFTCVLCGGSFKSDWSNEDAVAEFIETFHRQPTAYEIERRVCDDCWKVAMEYMKKHNV